MSAPFVMEPNQMHPLMSLLHDSSPFDGFDPSSYAEDLQGWGSDDPIFRRVIEGVRPKVIVEVGTWKGASAINMARVVKDLGLHTVIICVDTWLGSPEHFLAQEQSWRDSLLLKHGFPHLYFTFLANVLRSGYSDRIIPLPTTSENAAVILRAKGIWADLVYIDAAHEEEPAYRDFKLYWDLLTPDGCLLGDDYIAWEGVTRAADRFALDVRRPLAGKWGKFLISKHPAVQPGAGFDM